MNLKFMSMTTVKNIKYGNLPLLTLVNIEINNRYTHSLQVLKTSPSLDKTSKFQILSFQFTVIKGKAYSRFLSAQLAVIKGKASSRFPQFSFQ